MRLIAGTVAATLLAAASITAAAPAAEAANCTTATRIAKVTAHGSGQTVAKVNKRLKAKQRLWIRSGVMKVYRVPICHSSARVYVTYRSGRTDATWRGWLLIV